MFSKRLTITFPRFCSAILVFFGLFVMPWVGLAQDAVTTPETPEATAPAPTAQSQPSTTSPSPCLIVKHKGTVGRRLIFTALIGVPIAPGSKYDLVDTVNYNADKVAFKGKDLQELQAKGVHVTVLEKKYTPQDLESARKSCGGEQTAN
jgi:hypothetical protein